MKTILLISLISFLISCSGSRPERSFNTGPRSESGAIQCSNILSASSPWMGSPYKYGGTTKEGVDCSGFVQNIYKSVYGVTLPRTTTEMNKVGSSVRASWMICGDLIFFKNVRGSGVDHVGIYVGNNKFVHASTSRGVVVSDLTSRYYTKHLASIRRVLSE